MALRKWLVTGLGNSLLGADGFGPAVIDRLRRRSHLADNVELVDAHTDLLGLFDRFGSFDGVVLVDAVMGGDSPGVHVFEEDDFSAAAANVVNCHAVSPLVAVVLFRQLHPEARTRFTLVGLNVARIDATSTLNSADVEDGAAAVTRIVTAS